MPGRHRVRGLDVEAVDVDDDVLVLRHTFVTMALDDGPPNLLDSGPLYAGANVTRISDISPAAQIVNELTP